MIDITKIIVNDVNHIITEVFKNHRYQETVFLGKSLGTIPIINGLMKIDMNMNMNSKMIAYTTIKV
ncbi:UNVERIFIED_ORG: hypothetical protein ABIC97_001975 [Peribacillus simplex]